jgi:hypothetical protein
MKKGDWGKQGEEGEINWRRNKFLTVTRDDGKEEEGGEEGEGVTN